MALHLLLSLALSSVAPAASPWRTVCVEALTSIVGREARPSNVRLRNGEERPVRKLGPSNARATWRLANRIFPGDRVGLLSGFAASKVPSWALPTVSRWGTGIALGRLDYFVLGDGRGRPVGMTGLYAAEGSFDVWLGTLWTTNAAEYDAANALYRKRGFVEQKLDACDPHDPGSRLVVYSRALREGDETWLFRGKYDEALLGLSRAKIAEAVRLYDVERSCVDAEPTGVTP